MNIKKRKVCFVTLENPKQSLLEIFGVSPLTSPPALHTLIYSAGRLFFHVPSSLPPSPSVKIVIWMPMDQSTPIIERLSGRTIHLIDKYVHFDPSKLLM